MNQLPEIVISSYDLDRLEAILQRLPAANRPANGGLQGELTRAIVVDPSAIPSNVVTMNSVVKFKMSGSSGVHQVKLCYPKDSDASNNCISVLSPVGTALLGLQEGGRIAWEGPSGNPITLQVQELVFQPERELIKAS